MDYAGNDPTPLKTLTVKDFDPDDQPREKAERFGCSVLSVPDLLALILRTGTPGNPVTSMCRELMRDNGGKLHRLERRTRKELMERKGIGLTKSIQIEAIMELMKRYAEEEPLNEKPVTGAESIFKRMRYKIGNLPHEEIWILLLNRRNIVIREICMSTGTSNASLFDVRIAMKHALLEHADGIIMTHNHPSGTTMPSSNDDSITRSLKEACRFMNLRFLDHVIVTDSSFYSYHDNGKI